MIPILLADHRTKRFYRQRWRRYGPSLKSLAWTSHAAQERRFDALTGVGDLHGKTILDVGCGLGDLFAYLAARNIACEPHGYDIVPEFVQHCRRTYPHASVERRNILWSRPDRRFDYVLCCGLFAFATPPLFTRMLRSAWRLSTIALAFNIYRGRSRRYFKLEPEDAVAACRELSSSAEVTIVEGYAANDFTVFARRRGCA